MKKKVKILIIILFINILLLIYLKLFCFKFSSEEYNFYFSFFIIISFIFFYIIKNKKVFYFLIILFYLIFVIVFYYFFKDIFSDKFKKILYIYKSYFNPYFIFLFLYFAYFIFFAILIFINKSYYKIDYYLFYIFIISFVINILSGYFIFIIFKKDYNFYNIFNLKLFFCNSFILSIIYLKKNNIILNNKIKFKSAKIPILLFLIYILFILLNNFKKLTIKNIQTISVNYFIFTYLYCLNAGILEETIVRGFIFNFLLRKFKNNNIVKAILISSLIFALAHTKYYIVPIMFLPLFLAGIYFAFLYFKLRNLYFNIFFHFIIDFLGEILILFH